MTIETNDQLAELLLRWPKGTRLGGVQVDVNMSVDVEGVVESSEWDPDQGRFVPLLIIELPTPDISTVPPLSIVREPD